MPIILSGGGSGGGGGGIESIVAGSGIAVDATDPANPIVSSTGGIAPWIFKSASYDLAAWDKVVDVTGGNTFTLPNATGSGVAIEIIDGQGNWGTNVSTIVGKINGDSEGSDLDIAAGNIRLIDVGGDTGWYAN